MGLNQQKRSQGGWQNIPTNCQSCSNMTKLLSNVPTIGSYRLFLLDFWGNPWNTQRWFPGFPIPQNAIEKTSPSKHGPSNMRSKAIELLFPRHVLHSHAESLAITLHSIHLISGELWFPKTNFTTIQRHPVIVCIMHFSRCQNLNNIACIIANPVRRFDSTSICETILTSLLKILPFCDKVLPWKLTWNLKMDPWKRRFLLETILFRFHVSFQGCKFDVFWTYQSWRKFVSELYLHLGVQSPVDVENLVLRQMAQVTSKICPRNCWNCTSGALNWNNYHEYCHMCSWVSERYTYDQKWCFFFEIFWGPFGAPIFDKRLSLFHQQPETHSQQIETVQPGWRLNTETLVRFIGSPI